MAAQGEERGPARFWVSRSWLWSAGALGVSYIAIASMYALNSDRALGVFGAMFFAPIALLWLFLLIHFRRHPLLSVDDHGLTISGVWTSRRQVRWADVLGVKDGSHGSVLETSFGAVHLPLGWLSASDRSRVLAHLGERFPSAGRVP